MRAPVNDLISQGDPSNVLPLPLAALRRRQKDSFSQTPVSAAGAALRNGNKIHTVKASICKLLPLFGGVSKYKVFPVVHNKAPAS